MRQHLPSCLKPFWWIADTHTFITISINTQMLESNSNDHNILIADIFDHFLCFGCHSKTFTCIDSVTQQPYEKEAVILTLQTRRPSHAGTEYLIQGHPANKQPSWDSVQEIWLQSMPSIPLYCIVSLTANIYWALRCKHSSSKYSWTLNNRGSNYAGSLMCRFFFFFFFVRLFPFINCAFYFICYL